MDDCGQELKELIEQFIEFELFHVWLYNPIFVKKHRRPIRTKVEMDASGGQRQILISIRDAAAGPVNKTADPAPVQNYVWKAVVAVGKNKVFGRQARSQ